MQSAETKCYFWQYRTEVGVVFFVFKWKGLFTWATLLYKSFWNLLLCRWKLRESKDALDLTTCANHSWKEKRELKRVAPKKLYRYTERYVILPHYSQFGLSEIVINWCTNLHKNDCLGSPRCYKHAAYLDTSCPCGGTHIIRNGVLTPLTSPGLPPRLIIPGVPDRMQTTDTGLPSLRSGPGSPSEMNNGGSMSNNAGGELFSTGPRSLSITWMGLKPRFAVRGNERFTEF
jgi:hypothetical protein